MTKLKINVKNLIYHIGFLFRPIATVAVSFVFLVIAIVLLVVLIINLDENSQLYQVLLAILTGATASFLVSIMLELYSNYRFNVQRQRELREYLSYIARYGVIQNSAKKTDSKTEYKCELGNGRAYTVFVTLGTTIPVLKEALNQRDYLYRKEINEIDNILHDYNDVVLIIRMYLLGEFIDLIDGKTTAQEVENEALMMEQERKKLQKDNSVNADFESIIDYPEVFNFLKKEAVEYVKRKNPTNTEKQDVEQLESIIEKAIFFEREIFRGYFEVNDGMNHFDKLIEVELERQSISDKAKNLKRRSYIISHACSNIDEAMMDLQKRVKKEPYYWVMANYKE